MSTIQVMISAVLALLVMVGISMMSRVQTAVRGNLLSAFAMLVGVVATLVFSGVVSAWTIWPSIAIGALIGSLMARRVQMIQMPQTVALFNGLGGGASALVGMLSVMGVGFSQEQMAAIVLGGYFPFVLFTGLLAVAVGLITLVGSLVAAGKLHRVLPQQPLVWPHHSLLTLLFLAFTVLFVLVGTFSDSYSADTRILCLIGTAVAASLFGLYFSVRVGGADMPITISLLNSLSGVAGSIAGMAISDVFLVAVGGIVGASGLLLTQIMCRAMNRSLLSILVGAKKKAPLSSPEQKAPLSSPEGDTIDPAHKSNEAPSGAVWGASEPVEASHKDTVQALPDANLVNADLAQSGNSVLDGSAAKTAPELLDSTMLAVGARKIAEGTYIGHFQPSLHSDTVRIARATILDRKSQQTDEHLFAQNTDDPYAYNVTLNAETRKDRTGYYIRYLQPDSSTVRNYDKKEVDPKMLSTDSVLTKRSFRHIYTFTPVAIERVKKETRIYMYVGFRGDPQIDNWRQQNINHYSGYAIVDELTGDKYVCRSTDYDYFKYVKDESITYVKDGQSRKDTVKIYQTCLVFPPIGKNVRQAYFGPVKDDVRWSNTFDLTTIPCKGRIITK